jgi:hypothetical protein
VEEAVDLVEPILAVRAAAVLVLLVQVAQTVFLVLMDLEAVEAAVMLAPELVALVEME